MFFQHPPWFIEPINHRNVWYIVKELEEKLSREEEATGVARVMQTQLTKYRELEKENEKLKEENHYYRYNYILSLYCNLFFLPLLVFCFGWSGRRGV